MHKYEECSTLHMEKVMNRYHQPRFQPAMAYFYQMRVANW